jgi:putative transcriptional regulator
MKTPDKGRPDGTRLHNRLAVLRAERGMSRQELAEALEVNYQTIGYLERGEYNPSLDLALRIGELFGLPVEAVFSRTPFAPLSDLVYRCAESAAPLQRDARSPRVPR